MASGPAPAAPHTRLSSPPVPPPAPGAGLAESLPASTNHLTPGPRSIAQVCGLSPRRGRLVSAWALPGASRCGAAVPLDLLHSDPSSSLPRPDLRALAPIRSPGSFGSLRVCVASPAQIVSLQKIRALRARRPRAVAPTAPARGRLPVPRCPRREGARGAGGSTKLVALNQPSSRRRPGGAPSSRIRSLRSLCRERLPGPRGTPASTSLTAIGAFRRRGGSRKLGRWAFEGRPFDRCRSSRLLDIHPTIPLYSPCSSAILMATVGRCWRAHIRGRVPPLRPPARVGKSSPARFRSLAAG